MAHRATAIAGTGATLATNIGTTLVNFPFLASKLAAEFDTSTDARLAGFTATQAQSLTYNQACRFLLYQIALAANPTGPFGPGT